MADAAEPAPEKAAGSRKSKSTAAKKKGDRVEVQEGVDDTGAQASEAVPVQPGEASPKPRAKPKVAKKKGKKNYNFKRAEAAAVQASATADDERKRLHLNLETQMKLARLIDHNCQADN